MSLSFGKFTPSLPDKTKDMERNRERGRLIEAYVKNHNLVALKSDYLGMDSYYYDPKTRLMYKVHNCAGPFDASIEPQFQISRDSHIMRLNNLS